MEQLESRRLLAFNPTAIEQEYMQLVNRFRTDPAGEFSRLISQTSPVKARDPIFQLELDFFKVDGNALKRELEQLTPVPPLAWNPAVRDFTVNHNAAMVGSNPPQQFHSNSTERRQKLLDAGVDLRFANGEKIHSENVYGYAKSPTHLFAGYIVDWGNGSGGMQTNRPHRASIINDDFEQAGHAIRNYSGSNFGPLVNTQVLVNIENPPVMVTGAIFEDKNDSRWYEAGEGIGGVKFVFSGAAGTFETTGYGAGGYQIELPAGTYSATASGGGMKHPVTLSNITVDSTNVWTNFIYDPDAIPADSLESNNSRGAASALTGRDQSLTSLSIHVGSDVDYFRFEPASTGQAVFTSLFTHATGNLDLELLNSSGGVLSASRSDTNNESITANVNRGATYYLRVVSRGSDTNGSYRLNLDLPEPMRPTVLDDSHSLLAADQRLTIRPVDNDSDPDGDRTKLSVNLSSSAPTAFSVSGQQTIEYTVPTGYSGVHRAKYSVTDDQSLVSTEATISVFVVDFAADAPWQNAGQAVDVNDDARVSALDALLVINEINDRGSRQLPTSGSIEGMFGFIDVSGEGQLTPLDALLVINVLNQGGSAEGEGMAEVDQSATGSSTANRSLAVDWAVVDLFGRVQDVDEEEDGEGQYSENHDGERLLA